MQCATKFVLFNYNQYASITQILKSIRWSIHAVKDMNIYKHDVVQNHKQLQYCSMHMGQLCTSNKQDTLIYAGQAFDLAIATSWLFSYKIEPKL